MAKGGFDFNGSVLFHCYGDLTEAIIPEGTTEIADGAFSCNEYVKKIVIPDTVTKIGARAFGWCESLVEINIPDSVISIGERAFIDCGYIKKIKLGKNVEELGSYAFWLCSNLKEITLSPKLKRIENGTFLDCIRLDDVETGGNIVSIGDCAFKNTDLSFFDLGKKLEEIGDFAFENSDLITLEIPASVKKVGTKIADGCEWFQRFECFARSQPDGWDKEWNVVNGKKPFTVWDFANGNGVVAKYDKSLLYIEGSVLKHCDGAAKQVCVPNGVTTIDDRAFRDCKNLEKLSLPKSLCRICEDVFNANYGIRTLEYRGTLAEWCEVEFYDCDANPIRHSGEVIIGGKKLENLDIPKGIREINNYAFMGSGVKEIVLPEGLKRIGMDAFTDALITDISFPDSLEEIDRFAFDGCANLKEAVFPDGLKRIGEGAFDGCSNLLKVTLSRKTEVEDDAFDPFPNGFDELQIIYKD